ncbi:hypothetical protein F5Y16DRAFT_124108 [Xylariaceae sp. FL0255]|nr:hypothetical protein F5Y16DRAFT_124108 [Xylariaceae sp. FL0255]
MDHFTRSWTSRTAKTPWANDMLIHSPRSSIYAESARTKSSLGTFSERASSFGFRLKRGVQSNFKKLEKPVQAVKELVKEPVPIVELKLKKRIDPMLYDLSDSCATYDPTHTLTFVFQLEKQYTAPIVSKAGSQPIRACAIHNIRDERTIAQNLNAWICSLSEGSEYGPEDRRYILFVYKFNETRWLEHRTVFEFSWEHSDALFVARFEYPILRMVTESIRRTLHPIEKELLDDLDLKR